MLSSMTDDGLEFFVDDLDICVNEIVISGDDCPEIIPLTSFMEDTVSICHDLIPENMSTFDHDESSYLSESTEPMTDSESQLCNILINNDSMKTSENDMLRDLSNQISLRPRNMCSRKRKSPHKDSMKSDAKVTPTKQKRKSYSNDIVTIPSDYYVGRILWAKVKSHPWWPCMIYHCPNGTFYRELNNKKTIHVAYFGPYVERGWVSIKDIMPFEGKTKFDEYVKQLQENNSPKYILQQYSVSQSRLQVYTESWKEAEEAMMMSLEDRIEVHGISYKKLSGETSSSEDEADDKTQLLSVKEEPITKSILSYSKDSFEYERLKLPSFSNCKRSLICFLCIQGDECHDQSPVINCVGSCGQQFHVSCMTLLLDYLTSREPTSKEINHNKCVDCNRNVRRCFLCQKLGRMDKKDKMMKCSTGSCGRYYHSKCLYKGPYQQMIAFNRSGSLTCPSHTCHSCYMDNPGSVRSCANHIRCLMCPASFHKGEWCIPAGSKEINDCYIICPQHLALGGNAEISIFPFMDCIKNGVVKLQSINFRISSYNDSQNQDLWVLDKVLKASKSKSNNVTWCFICSKGGNLICCERCPASFHQKCVDIQEVPDVYICEECQMGKYPRYGEVYWLKIGSYRWWPGQIIHSKNAPERVLKASRGEGQFLVQFFGSNDYYWMNKTHAFPFEEGDEMHHTDTKKTSGNISDDSSSSRNSQTEVVSGNTKLDRDYKKSLVIAAKVLASRQTKWEMILGQKAKPSQYRSIKVNIPIGNVRINKPLDLSEVPQCECRSDNEKNNLDPCGRTSDCMNRELMYECHPQVCRNGEKCRNQRFTRREYPKQEVFLTQNRGWALKTLQPLKKGDFVNEYVGEVIDESEATRRLKKAHENNITNFYMMELDGQRIIDAGPSANQSRFMNHSCSPNVYTEKWTVNGDTRIGLFALHNIAADEELTFNYNFFSLGQTKLECKCGATNCSGFLGDPPKVISSDNLSVEKTSVIKKSQNSTKKSNPKVVISQKKVSAYKKTLKNETTKSQNSVKAKPINGDCFMCSQPKCQIVCSYGACAQAYHLDCLNLKQTPNTLWLCPLHYCDDCGQISSYFCGECPTSYCSLHRFDRLINLENDLFICSNHEDFFISQGSPAESQNGSINATISITGTDSLPSVSI